jgi:hypothetical protein
MRAVQHHANFFAAAASAICLLKTTSYSARSTLAGPELRMPVPAAQTRMVSEANFGWISANLSDRSKDNLPRRSVYDPVRPRIIVEVRSS